MAQHIEEKPTAPEDIMDFVDTAGQPVQNPAVSMDKDLKTVLESVDKRKRVNQSTNPSERSNVQPSKKKVRQNNVSAELLKFLAVAATVAGLKDLL